MKYVNFPLQTEGFKNGSSKAFGQGSAGTEEKISVIGLGTWVFGGEHWGGADDGECLAAVDAAIESGINLIDTAPFYSDGKSERLVGQAIKGRREKVFIATKCGLVRENGRVRHDLTPESIYREVDLSLERLDCDVIDLYMCHWPDPSTPIENTMEAMLKLREKRKIRHIGVSNFDLPLLKKACALAPVVTLQAQYSLLDRGIEKDLLPFCREQGLGLIAYGAMAGGLLTGKYDKIPAFGKRDARRMFYSSFEGEKLKAARVLMGDLKGLGRPLNQVFLNWVRQQPGVMTVLAGARDPQQVKSNAAAADNELSSKEIQIINQ